MELFKKVCKNSKCGKEFMGTRTQQYCCPDCRVLTTVKKPKPCSIDEICRKAKEHGTTYGKYVEMLYKQERMKK